MSVIAEAFSRIEAHIALFVNRYFAAVSDVLTSVQKTEESLRRLKNLREKTAPNAAAAAEQQQRPMMTDDDKIRLQLQVDVGHWSDQIAKLGQSDVPKLYELLTLVEESTKIRVTSANVQNGC